MCFIKNYFIYHLLCRKTLYFPHSNLILFINILENFDAYKYLCKRLRKCGTLVYNVQVKSILTFLKIGFH